MQNKQLSQIALTIISLLILRGDVCAAPQSSEDVELQVKHLLLKFEIRGNDINQVLDLPASSVAILTQGLNKLQPNQPTEPRHFGFLVIKLEQFHAVLPIEVKQAALEALTKNIEVKEEWYRDIRQKEVSELKKVITGEIQPYGIGLSTDDRSRYLSKMLQTSKAAQLNVEQAPVVSIWTWLALALLVLLGVFFLWLRQRA